MPNGNELVHIATLITTAKTEAARNLEQSLQLLRKDFADEHYSYLWKLREIEGEIESLQGTRVLPSVPTYVIGSLFLSQCKSLLTRDEKESMFYVTGTEETGSIYLTTLVTFECSKRNVTGVHGDDESVFDAVMKMEQAGHRLFCWLHSHPGSQSACSPSTTDIGMQQRLESLNYPAIGGIFTRDGYIRFFGVEHEFQIQIHGKGVEDVDPEKFLYKINLPD